MMTSPWSQWFSGLRGDLRSARRMLVRNKGVTDSARIVEVYTSFPRPDATLDGTSAVGRFDIARRHR